MFIHICLAEAGDEDNSRDIVRRAAAAVGSLSDTEFNITFNPDVFQPHVKHANPEVKRVILIVTVMLINI